MAETLQSLIAKADDDLTALCAFLPDRRDRAYMARVREGMGILEKAGLGGATPALPQRIARLVLDRANERTAR